MNLEKGIKVFMSKKGYNGFLYPCSTETRASLLFTVNAKILCWVGGGPQLMPVLVPENSITMAGDPRVSVPVWIDRN